MSGGDETFSSSGGHKITGSGSQISEGTAASPASANVVTIHSINRPGSHATALQLFVDDEELPSEFANLFSTIDGIIQALDAAVEFLADGKMLNADNQFIVARTYSSELFMSRSLSDSIGLIAMKVIWALSNLAVSDQADSQIRVIKSVLTKLHRAPMIDFCRAMELAGEIEAACGEMSLPGFEPIADALIEASELE